MFVLLFLAFFSKETWILIAAIIGLSWLHIHRKLQKLKSTNIPDSDSGFLGYKHMKRFKEDFNHAFFYGDIEKRKKYGDVYMSIAFLTPITTIWDPEMMKQIYIKEHSNFPDRQKTLLKIGAELNDGLVSINGQQWKRVRTTLSPTFSSLKLKEMLPFVQNCGDKLVRNLQKASDNKEQNFDAKILLGRFTMDVICSAAFSGDFHVQDGDTEPESIKIIREAFSAAMFQKPIIFILTIFPWLEYWLEKANYTIHGEKFRKTMNGIINAALKPENRPNRTDLLQLMLKSEISPSEAKTAMKGLTKREIQGNSQLMVLAGYETTSTTLCFLIYNLAMNESCQDKLREEIQDSVDRHQGNLGYEAINDIKYLNMCIEESLRIYPPAPLNARFAEKDITIKGYRILKGMVLQFPLFGMGRDATYWDEPESFRPERMEDMSKIDPLYHQPFGAGPRNCIGMRFALMVLKLAVCKILLNFKVLPTEKTPAAPLELVFGATLGAKEDIELKVEPL